MGESDFEGLERRLSDTHDKIEPRPSDKQRRDSAVADTEGIEFNVTPPLALIKQLEGSVEGALCEQRMQLVWPTGPRKGLPVTGYCAEPLCINEGACTGTRFVPHAEQYTSTIPEMRQKRTLAPDEVVGAVRTFAKRAALTTGRDEDRTDKEILAHVKTVWMKTIRYVRGKGDWRPT